MPNINYIWVIHSKQCAKCPITNTRWPLWIRRTVWIKAAEGGGINGKGNFGNRAFLRTMARVPNGIWHPGPNTSIN